MRFMMMVKANKDTEAGVMPSEKSWPPWRSTTRSWSRPACMLDGTGLQPSSKGARVKFSGGKRTVIDGPFAETKELIAGYWLIQVKSKEEAIEWAKRCPRSRRDGRDGEIEIRQVFELEDFGASDAVDHHREVARELAKKNVVVARASGTLPAITPA